MNIENEIFKKSHADIKKIISYGFIEKNNIYIYKHKIYNDFIAIVTILKDETVTGKIVDLEQNEEYTNYRTEMTGEFTNRIREAYKELLIDIKNNCFNEDYFIYGQTNRVVKYIKEKYNIMPEFLWSNSPGDAIFRCPNNKWFGIIMTIDKSRLESSKRGLVEAMNVKIKNDDIPSLLIKKGYYQAYHMNKKNWITIILDDTLADKEIFKLIDNSYNLIENKEVTL